MEACSSYQNAIQAISRSTPGEKFKELNLIAKKIVEHTKAHGDSVLANAISEVPEALLPLLKVEVANILRQSEAIVEALKSEDSIVVKRALRMNWFFRDGDTDIINVDYFDTHILPYVTLNTRNELIKQLASNLRASNDTKLGEAFYAYFFSKYGRNTAEPLFIACREDFIFDNVTKHKLILSCRIVNLLFEKYPDLVIRYLKLLKPDENGIIYHNHNVDISKYTDFLPKLVKKHLNVFTELIEIHPKGYTIKLSNKSTHIFLKNNVNALLENPDLYMHIMPLKIITSKLTRSQFKAMFAKFFPEKPKYFSYQFYESKLHFYPEEDRISLIKETYKDVYNADLVDDPKAICRTLLAMLPKDERARHARIKLEKEPDWRSRRYIYEKTWRCYLPIEESIPAIMNDLSKCSSDEDRYALLTQMFYTCKINNDDDALTETLRYFTTHLKNEETSKIFDILRRIERIFDVFTFGKEHWAILDDFLKFLEAKGELSHFIPVSIKFLAGSVYYDLRHDQPIEDKIAMIIKLNFIGHESRWTLSLAFLGSWSIMEKFPEYNKLCFDTLLSTIPSIYPLNHNIWEEHRYGRLANIVQSIYKFNDFNVESNNKIEKVSVKNYTWLYNELKNVIQFGRIECSVGYMLLSIVQTNEPEVYKECTKRDEFVGTQSFDALKSSTFENTGEGSNEQHGIVETIPHAMEMTNPPVPLSRLLSFCEDDDLDLSLASLTNAFRRTSIEEAKRFAKTLVDSRVSVRKHFIRLYCLVASIDERKTFLTDLWKNETHGSIRAVVFAKITELFVSEPTLETWKIMKGCLADWNVDDEEIVKRPMNILKLPDEFLADYVQQLLETYEKLQADGFEASCIVRKIDFAISCITRAPENLLHEDFSQRLLRRYFLNPAYVKVIIGAVTTYAMKRYVRPNEAGLESRLSFLCGLYEDALKKHWDVPYPNNPTLSPINCFFEDFISWVVFSWNGTSAKITILESILKSYLTVLKPEQDFYSYALLVFSIALQGAKTAADVAMKIGETAPLVDGALSPELINRTAVGVGLLINDCFTVLYEREAEVNQVIENLCNVGNVQSCILAAKLLDIKDVKNKFDERYKKIVDILRQSKHPAAMSIVNKLVDPPEVQN